MAKKLQPGQSRLVTIEAYEYSCARCGHEGLALPDAQGHAALPKRCGSCKSPYWMDRPGVRRRGRPRLFRLAEVGPFAFRRELGRYDTLKEAMDAGDAAASVLRLDVTQGAPGEDPALRASRDPKKKRWALIG